MNDLLMHSKEIVDKAILDYKPKAVVMMFSGGDDSLTAYHVARELGYKFDYVIHGNTRTGIAETTLFSRNEVASLGDRYLEADAGKTYENYVLRKGFFGKGIDAHTFAYHLLKYNQFRRVVSENIRKKRRAFPILFINGARRLESDNRRITMANPIKVDGSNVWVNIINEWDKPECISYLEGNGINRNPVAIQLCRSGECMCGTMQTKDDYNEAKILFPKWGSYMDELRKAVTDKFPWDWGENINKQHHMEMKGQLNLFQPMCTGCKINFNQTSILNTPPVRG
jgi:3'-phosphoadenosine 5'-phosphosulfate sulfotransferase (PAPS reductase)/FAD synthetase